MALRAAMIIAMFIASSVVGVNHEAALVGIVVVGAGLQSTTLIAWYLHYTSEKRRRAERELADLQEPNLDRLNGR